MTSSSATVLVSLIPLGHELWWGVWWYSQNPLLHACITYSTFGCGHYSGITSPSSLVYPWIVVLPTARIVVPIYQPHTKNGGWTVENTTTTHDTTMNYEQHSWRWRRRTIIIEYCNIDDPLELEREQCQVYSIFWGFRMVLLFNTTEDVNKQSHYSTIDIVCVRLVCCKRYLRCHKWTSFFHHEHHSRSVAYWNFVCYCHLLNSIKILFGTNKSNHCIFII